MRAAPIHPLQPGGAAEDVAALLGRRGSLMIEDRTAFPRWGLKGLGSTDWLAAYGIALPELNRCGDSRGLVVLRLGRNDIVFIGDAGDSGPRDALAAAWRAAATPKGYESWRHEGWAWLTLSGPSLDDALSRLTGLDLRSGRFALDEVAQTRVAGVDAVLFRRSGLAHILFDVAATAAVLRTIAATASPLDDRHPDDILTEQRP